MYRTLANRRASWSIVLVALFAATACSATASFSESVEPSTGTTQTGITQTGITQTGGTQTAGGGPAPAPDRAPDPSVDRATDAQSGLGEEFASEFETTPEFLAFAADRSEAASHYRFEFFQEVESNLFELGSRDTAFMTGAVAEDRATTNMDMSSLLGASFAGLDGAEDLSAAMIFDDGFMYMRAPFYAAVLDQLSPDSAYEWMSTVAQGWGRIDLQEIDRNAALEAAGSIGLEGSFGANASDPTGLLPLLEGVGETLDGGVGEVRGVPTRIIYATIDLREVAQRMPDSMNGVEIPASFVDTLPANLEVHVDPQDKVRRVELRMDLGPLLEIANEDLTVRDIEMDIWQRFDLFDFGTEIEIPVPVDAVDITQQFAAAVQAGG